MKKMRITITNKEYVVFSQERYAYDDVAPESKNTDGEIIVKGTFKKLEIAAGCVVIDYTVPYYKKERSIIINMHAYKGVEIL